MALACPPFLFSCLVDGEPSLVAVQMHTCSLCSKIRVEWGRLAAGHSVAVE